MNKKGNIFFAIVIATVIFMFGMLVVNFMKDDITLVKNSTGLDCTNSSISDGIKVSCLAMDSVIPYLFILILSAAGGLIAAELTL